MKRFLSIATLLAGVVVAFSTHAESVTVTDSPGAFSATGPTGWSRQPPATGNSRLKFVSPSGTPDAECAVIVKRAPFLRGLSPSDITSYMLQKPDPADVARGLAGTFGDVHVISVGNATLSGAPAQTFNVHYSVGTPAGTQWIRGVTTTTITPPDVSWTITCGGQGRTLAEAQKAFDYWQVEIVKFPTFVKFSP